MNVIKKYELLKDNKILPNLCVPLYQIKALVDIPEYEVLAGDLGGYIESEDNLSHLGSCWVFDEAQVFNNARVCDNACVFNNAQVYGNAYILDNAKVFNNARIRGNAKLLENSHVYGTAEVYGNAKVFRDAHVFGDARLYGNAYILGSAFIGKCSDVFWVSGIGISTSSENVTLTVYRGKDSQLLASIGCFNGTLDEFKDEVKKYTTGKIKKEYKMLIKFAELRLSQ